MSDSEDFASASEGEESRSTSPARPSDKPKSPAKEHIQSAINETSSNTGNNANNGGWGGWGSWLSNAVAAVQESFNDDMDELMTTAKDLGDTVKKVTEDGMDKVYETLEHSPGNDAAERPEGSSTEGVNAETEPKEGERGMGIKTGNLLQSTELVLGSIDKALDLTSDLLGNAVLV